MNSSTPPSERALGPETRRWVALAGVILWVHGYGHAAPQLRKGADGHREIRDVTIPMRDGAALAADVFLPRQAGRHPTILIMTPYNRAYLAAALPDPTLKTRLFARDLYAYVVVDWRGFYGSKAATFKKGALGEDGYDTVEWIAGQPWSDGKVGMWGKSAVGKVGFYTAEQRPPHLVCIAPLVAAYGYRYGQFYHGGVLKEGYVDTVERVGFDLRDFRAHPTEDEFWEFVAQARRTSRINVPMLLMSGWYDLYVEGIIDTFRAIRSDAGPVARESVKLLIGPWVHNHVGKPQQGELIYADAAHFYDREVRRFFDYWLRGQGDNGWAQTSPIRYIQMSTDRWKTAEDWPPEGVSQVAWYLAPGGRLGADEPAAERAPDSFRYDPQSPSPTVGGMVVSKWWDASTPQTPDGPCDQRSRVESRDDCLIYTTQALESDVCVTGVPRVRLFVSSDRRDTDFAVRLTDVYPDGRSMLVSDGIQRMCYRKSTRAEQPLALGRVYEVTVELSTTAYAFQRGHKIRIVVSSSNYPRFSVNPNTGRPPNPGERGLVATNQVYCGPEQPSALLLPVTAGQGDPQRRTGLGGKP